MAIEALQKAQVGQPVAPAPGAKSASSGNGPAAPVHGGAERFNGAQRRGYALGKRLHAVVLDDKGGVVGGSAATTVSLADASTPSKGTVQLEPGQSYVLTPTAHPGAKYAIAGLGDDGVTNPHNIKGVFALATAQAVKAGKQVDRSPALAPVVDKVSEFLARRGKIADKAPSDDHAAPKTGKIDRKLLEGAGVLKAGTGEILNIHDDRFDTGKFTHGQVVSLELAASLATGDKADVAGTEQQPGKRLGQLKDHGGKAYGHDASHGRTPQDVHVSARVISLLRGGFYA